MKINLKQKTLLLTLFVTILWGSLFPMVKIGYEAYNISSTGDILFFAGVRFTLCGALIMAIAACHGRRNYANTVKYLPQILLSGFFAVVLHYGFTYLGLSRSGSSEAALLKQIGFLAYILASPLFVRSDKLSVQKIIGAIIGFGGIVVLNSGSGGIRLSIGDWFIIAASFSMAISNVISKSIFDSVSPLTATGISQFFGGIILLAAGIVSGGRISAGTPIPMMCICGASIVSYCLWFSLLKEGELSQMFITKFAEPLFAAIFSAVLLGENIFSMRYLTAFVIVFAGICIANLKRRTIK